MWIAFFSELSMLKIKDSSYYLYFGIEIEVRIEI